MIRGLVVVLVSVIAGLVTHARTDNDLLSVCVGLAGAVVTGLAAFSKDVIGLIQGWYELEKSRDEAKSRRRRIVAPNDDQIRKFGTPYRVVKRDLPAGYRKEIEVVEVKPFVVSAEESRDVERDQRKE